jgi:hypothetical protein
MRRRRIGLVLAFSAAFMAGAPPAGAAAFLVGAQLYSCSGDGTNGGPGSYGPAYQYSTNSSTSHLSLSVRGLSSAISFLLEPGENDFFYLTSGIDPGDYACMNLFFSDADESYNPPYTFPDGIPGELVVVAPIGGSTFSIPAAGTNVQAYNSTGAAYLDAYYSGAGSLEVGGETVTVTGFTVLPTIEGILTITLPEPGAAWLGAAAVLALGARHRSAPVRSDC